MNTRDKLIIAASMIAIVVLLFLIGATLNPAGFWKFWDEVGNDLRIAIRVVFIVGGLLVASGVVLWYLRERKVIRPTKYGGAQAVIHRGEIIQLTTVAMEPGQQLALLDQVLKVSGTAALMTKRLSPYIEANAENTVDADERKQLPAPSKVPTGRELLLSGKVEEALRQGLIILGLDEKRELAHLKVKRCFSTLISGLPSVGKSTTVFWIVGQLILIDAKFWVVDPHMHFQDEDGNKSLAAELSELADSMVFPPCDDDVRQVVYRLKFMYEELRRRQKPGYIVRARDTIIGIMDEFNSIADSVDPALAVVKHAGQDLNFAQTLALIEREGRKFGLHFMLIGHKWASQDIGGDNAVRTNATTYLCHKLNDQGQADLLLGRGQGKKVLSLTVGSYWITGPTWNAEPARITTPAISAVDLPVLLAIKRRGIQLLNEGNVVEAAISAVMSRDMSMPSPLSSPQEPNGHNARRNTDELGKLADMTDTTTPEITLPAELQAKMHLVLDMDAQGSKSQNEIITQIWGVDPSTRQGRAAAEELRQIRAYLAKVNKKHLQTGGE